MCARIRTRCGVCLGTQAVTKSVESCRQHKQRLAAQAAAAGVATGESDDEEEELSPDEPLAAVREHLRTLRSSLPTALNSPARAGRNTAASLAKQAKAAGRGRGAPGSKQAKGGEVKGKRARVCVRASGGAGCRDCVA